MIFTDISRTLARHNYSKQFGHSMPVLLEKAYKLGHIYFFVGLMVWLNRDEDRWIKLVNANITLILLAVIPVLWFLFRVNL